MFCPESVMYNGPYIYIVHHGIGDVSWKYRSWTERHNPLRYSIGVRLRKNEKPSFYINKDSKLQMRWAKFNWWLWKKRYRQIFGYPSRKK